MVLWVQLDSVSVVDDGHRQVSHVCQNLSSGLNKVSMDIQIFVMQETKEILIELCAIGLFNHSFPCGNNS